MARERERSGDGKAKVRIFFAEVDGGDDTIQDGLRSLAQALVRATQPPMPARQARPLALDAGKPAQTVNGQGTLFPPEPDPAEADHHEELAQDEFHPAEPRPKEQRQRKAASYRIVSDLNLRPEGKQSLKEFVAEKRPDGLQEQVAVFVYYLSHTLAVPKIGPHHLFTCFKDIGARVPTDISDVANKTKVKGWIGVSKGEGYTPTTHGDNLVDHDLPKPAD